MEMYLERVRDLEDILRDEVDFVYKHSYSSEDFNVAWITDERIRDLLMMAEKLTRVMIDIPEVVTRAAIVGIAWKLFFEAGDYYSMKININPRKGVAEVVKYEYPISYFIEEDEKGRKKVQYNNIVKYLCKKFLPISTGYPNGTIFIWDGKKYKMNKGEIEDTISQILEGEFNTKQIRNHTGEIMFRLQIKTLGSSRIFNKFEDILPVKNGYLYNRELLPHTPAFAFTYCINAKYNPDAKCPNIDEFIRQVVTEENVQVLYDIPAICLLNEQYHYAYMLYGTGSNGKSTYLTIVRKFLGEENISSVTFQELCNNRFAAAHLFGKLANICADIPADPVKYTGMFKMLTGGDMIKAEFKFRDPFEFVNRAKLVFSCNELPEANDTTDAFWRRWIILQFPYKFSRNPDLLKELITEEELSGFLNKVLEAMTRIELQGHPTITQTMEDVMNEWQKRANPVSGFAKECVVEEVNSYETKEDVYNAYKSYCKLNELKIVSKTKFGLEFQKHLNVKTSLKRIAGRVVRCWEGIKLRCGDCGKCYEKEGKVTEGLASFGDFEGGEEIEIDLSDVK